MESYVFPSAESLQVALTSGLVPVEVQRAPARVGRGDDGSVELAPLVPFPARSKKALSSAGVTAREASQPLAAVSCWAEALLPRRVPIGDGAVKLVLFTLEREATLLDLAGELLRLGCDRLELRLLDGPQAHALVRVVEPPWFVLSRAIDRLDGLRAFVPAPPGQDRVWTELGYQHPLDAALDAPEQGLVLIRGEGDWWRLPEGAWTDVDQLVTPSNLPVGEALPASVSLPQIPVTLTLARAARPEAPTLFVLRGGREQVESLVRSTPEAQLDNILFAVAGEVIVLRARPGREANTGALPGDPYGRVLDLPNLFAPAGTTIEPPLRRDRLRAWLAADPDLLTWLEPTEHARAGASGEPGARGGASEEPHARAGASGAPGARGGASGEPHARAGASGAPGAGAGAAGEPHARAGASGEPGARAGASGEPGARAGASGEPHARAGASGEPGAREPGAARRGAPAEGFARFSVEEAAFRPLSDWVEYVIDGAAETLHTWEKSASFDFEPWVALQDAPPRSGERDDEGAPPEKGKRRPEAAQRRPQRADAAQRPPQEPSAAATPQAPAPVAAAAQATLSELETLLAREEAAFLELDAPADSPARREGWARLAELYTRLQRPRDGGLAWSHAVWEASADEARAVARRWADTSAVRFEGLLAQDSPNAEQTRGAVAYLLAAALEKNPTVSSRLADWSGFLDRFDGDLDVRSLWLGRYALSELAGGDRLGLARARDRVLARLQRGLSLDRDVPRLLRVTGQGTAGGVGTERAHRVSAQLEALLVAFNETPRKRSTIEAPPHLTRAYVELEFAWGFARLGMSDRALRLRDGALKVLDQSMPAHNYLCRAYSARIAQAVDGAAPDTPLPPEIGAQLSGLEPFIRFKVDRLRQASQVLEPQERLDPFANWTSNLRGEELAALRGLKNPADLLRAIEARAAVAADPKLGAEERGRLLDGLIDFLPQLPESQALPVLGKLVGYAEPLPPAIRAAVLEDALKVAGHFGRTALVRQLVHSLSTLIKELGAEGVVEIGNMLVAGVRSLRRVGLREEAAEVLARAATVLRGEDLKTLQARLALASGFAYLGDSQRAQPTIDAVLNKLSRETGLQLGERRELSRAVARALANTSTQIALSGLLRLSQQIAWTTDSFATNDHFCLCLVELADALVLGHVGDDLTLNETTRRFLEEDEYLVRRRVHRDVGAEAT